MKEITHVQINYSFKFPPHLEILRVTRNTGYPTYVSWLYKFYFARWHHCTMQHRRKKWHNSEQKKRAL